MIVIEGLSTAITLPEKVQSTTDLSVPFLHDNHDDFSTCIIWKVDLVLAEIVGSVASEEGIVATIADARLRHVKSPNDPSSFIPARVQTWAAPAAYSPHLLFGPPDFDWTKV